MFHLKIAFTVLCLGAFATPAYCQFDREPHFGHDFTPLPIYGSHYEAAPTTWLPPSDPSHKFPLRVRLLFQENRFNGYYFVGAGMADMQGGQFGGFSFRYRCGLTFAADSPVDYPARWTKPGKTIAIQIENPNSAHTASCRLHTTAIAIPPSPRAPSAPRSR